MDDWITVEPQSTEAQENPHQGNPLNSPEPVIQAVCVAKPEQTLEEVQKSAPPAPQGQADTTDPNSTLENLLHKVDPADLRPGDHIYVYLMVGLYAHHGIVLSNGAPGDLLNTILVMNFRGWESKNLISVVPLAEFSKGATMGIQRYRYGVTYTEFVLKRGGTCSYLESDSVLVTLLRACYLIGLCQSKSIEDFNYNAITRNCELFSSWCKLGERSGIKNVEVDHQFLGQSHPLRIIQTTAGIGLVGAAVLGGIVAATPEVGGAMIGSGLMLLRQGRLLSSVVAGVVAVRNLSESVSEKDEPEGPRPPQSDSLLSAIFGEVLTEVKGVPAELIHSIALDNMRVSQYSLAILEKLEADPNKPEQTITKVLKSISQH